MAHNCFCPKGPIGFPGDSGPSGEPGTNVSINVLILFIIINLFLITSPTLHFLIQGIDGGPGPKGDNGAAGKSVRIFFWLFCF